MKKAFFAIFFFFHILPFIYGQDSLSITLDFDKDTLEILSPWSFTLQVTNRTNRDISEYPLLIEAGWIIQFGLIKLQIRQGDGAHWQNANIVSSRQSEIYSGGINHSKILHPFESMRGEFTCASPVGLIKPGKVDVRILYYPLEKKDFIASSPVTLFLKDYHGIDSLAYNYIKNQPRPDFFLHPAFPSIIVDTSDIFRAEYLISTFPGSSMEPHVVLYLASIYCLMARNKSFKAENHAQVLPYLRLSKKYALKALETGDSKGIKIATRILQVYVDILFTLYSYGVPQEIEDEFILPFQN
ncbi:MAG TPA: hypothetical protein VK168_10995 [Saprospiraceae bacterium]|nr:hypothetical protein [Saprospiraceae bacterium]